MKITTVSEAPRVPFDLEGYIMHTSHSAEIVHLLLKPGESVALHTNPFEVVACTLNDDVTLLYEQQQLVAGKYSTIEIEAGAMRGFINHNKHVIRLLIIKKF
jgi:quercetin dioxygenase-like cupin family protein